MTCGRMPLVILDSDGEPQLLTVIELRERQCMRLNGFNVRAVLWRIMVLAHTGLLGDNEKAVSEFVNLER